MVRRRNGAFKLVLPYAPCGTPREPGARSMPSSWPKVRLRIRNTANMAETRTKLPRRGWPRWMRERLMIQAYGMVCEHAATMQHAHDDSVRA